MKTTQKYTPQSLEAEQSALGAMMMENEAIAIAVSLLADTDFYRELHRKIFLAIVELYMDEQPVDLITIVEELRRRNQLEEVGGAAYLTAIIESCPSSASIETYCRTIIEKSALRKILSASEQMRAAVYSDSKTSPLDIVKIGQELVAEAARKANSNGRPTTISADDLDEMEFPEPNWVVPGILPTGLFIFGGKVKMGKSWLAQALALSVASGGKFLGELDVKQGEVLYLALEDTPYRLQDRQRKVMQGERLPSDLHYQTDWPRADEGGLERIEQWLDLHGRARLIVIDILQKFRPPRSKGGDIYGEDYAALSAIKRLADERDVCILVLHHLSKRECDDVVEALSGSVGVAGTADGTWVLERKRASPEATLHISGRDVGDMEKALLWHETIFSWALLGDAEVIREESTREKILSALSEKGETLSAPEIAEDIDLPTPTVAKMLKRLEADGEIQRPHRGHYRIPVKYLTNKDFPPAIERSMP